MKERNTSECKYIDITLTLGKAIFKEMPVYKIETQLKSEEVHVHFLFNRPKGKLYAT